MNDTPRRRSPDGFDDDAIFADIVAHMNDDVAETEPSARPAADHGSAGTETTDSGSTDTKTDTGAGADATTAGQPTPETTDAYADAAEIEIATSESSPGATELPPADTPEGDNDQGRVKETAGPAVHGPQVWRAHEVDEEYEEHFDPPPVSPLPVGDLQFWAIIAGMGGGPLLLLYLVFFNRDASGYWVLAAIAMSIAGFALLVSRMPHHHEDDDDGARL